MLITSVLRSTTDRFFAHFLFLSVTYLSPLPESFQKSIYWVGAILEGATESCRPMTSPTRGMPAVFLVLDK